MDGVPPKSALAVPGCILFALAINIVLFKVYYATFRTSSERINLYCKVPDLRVPSDLVIAFYTFSAVLVVAIQWHSVAARCKIHSGARLCLPSLMDLMHEQAVIVALLASATVIPWLICQFLSSQCVA